MTLRTSARRSAASPQVVAHRSNVRMNSCNASHRTWPRGKGGIVLDARRMSTSSVARFNRPASRSRRSSRKSVSHNLFGSAAIACLVLGCSWTVYSNIFAGNVYPTLGSSNFDTPVTREPLTVADRFAPLAGNNVVSAPSEPAPPIAPDSRQ